MGITLTPIEILGRGTFGYVSRALYNDKSVAVKIYNPLNPTKSSPAQLAKLLAEEIAVMQLLPIDQNIIRFVTQLDDGFAMEYIDGCDLQKTWQSFPNLPFAKRADYALQILNGVNVLHQANILHLDLKPNNILVSKDGRVVICDYGLSIISEHGCILKSARGTPLYMAPEVTWDRKHSKATDVYALGFVLWEWFTGQFFAQKIKTKEYAKLIFMGYRPSLRDANQVESRLALLLFCLWRHLDVERCSIDEACQILKSITDDHAQQVEVTMTDATKKYGFFKDELSGLLAMVYDRNADLVARFLASPTFQPAWLTGLTHNGVAPFLQAIRSNQPGIVKQFLESPSANSALLRLADDRTPCGAFYEVVSVGNIEMTQAILAHPAFDKTVFDSLFAWEKHPEDLDEIDESMCWECVLLIPADKRICAAGSPLNQVQTIKEILTHREFTARHLKQILSLIPNDAIPADALIVHMQCYHIYKNLELAAKRHNDEFAIALLKEDHLSMLTWYEKLIAYKNEMPIDAPERKYLQQAMRLAQWALNPKKAVVLETQPPIAGRTVPETSPNPTQ